MAQATTLGSLLIQLGMDSAQFERSAQRAQSTVQKMSKNIGVSAKDVVAASNRMGVSVVSFAGQVQALQGRLNPGIQALANYRREANLLKEAYRIGAISQEQFRTSLRGTIQDFRTAGKQVRASTGSMQSGMQQLNYQLGDMATMFALGAKPQQIFASQASQTIQAISLMTNGAGKFGAFMAGPWGAAITAGVVVLSSLLPVLLDTEKAMTDVERASDGLADAQSVLGDMFDLTTGKLQKQNAMLRLNAQIMAYNLRMQAASERSNFEKTLGNFQQGNLGLSTTQKVIGAFGVPVGGAMNRENAVRSIAQDLNAGKISSETAFKRAEGLDFSGLSVTRDQFLGAIRDGVSFPDKKKISDEILKSLDSGVLSPMFREDAKGSKTARSASGKTVAEIAADQAKDLDRLGQEELRARLDVATNAEERATISRDLLAAEKEQRMHEIDANADFSKEQKAAQKAYIERLYGTSKLNADGSIEVTPSLYGTALNKDIAAEEARLANDMLDRQASVLQAWADIEPNSKERAKLEKQALDLQQQIQRNLLEQAIANGQIADAAQARALLEQRQAADRRRSDLQNMSPLAAYRYNLKSSVANINDAIEGIQVDGLQSLTDGIAGAIAGTQKLGDVFKNVTQQIIADLIRIQIQRAVVGGLTSALGGIFGGGPSINGVTGAGFASSIGGAVSGWASGTTVKLAGARAAGGPVRAGLPYLVGERGPEIVVPSQPSQVIPNHELQGMGGMSVQIVPSEYFDVVVDQRAAGVAAPMAVASGVQARAAAGADMARKARRRIPGR